MATAVKKPQPTLERTLFETSRELEFFDAGELVKQTSYEKAYWPLIVLKELLDNSLDACESASVAPDVAATVEQKDGTLLISVADNGPGMAPETVARLLNFGTKLSDKAAYRSPTRGQQGNAWKTLLAVPLVMSTATPKAGKVVIESRGIRHTITTTVDLLAQRPMFSHEKDGIVNSAGCKVVVALDSSGTVRRYGWRGFLQILEGYALINPHMNLRCGFLLPSCPQPFQ